MVTLIVGKKGAGKTKVMVDAANEAAKTISGNVVVVEPGENLTREIAHEARLISLAPYGIETADQLFGFISGICSGNYDIQEVYVDSVLKIVDEDICPLFVQRMLTLSAYAETNITLSVSLDESEIPAELKEQVQVVVANAC